MSPMTPKELRIHMPAYIDMPHYYHREREGIRLDFRTERDEDFERMIDLSKRLNTQEPDNVVIEVIAEVPEEDYYLIGRLDNIYHCYYGVPDYPLGLPDLMGPKGPRKVINRDGSFFINELIFRELCGNTRLLDRFVEFRPFQGLLVDRLDIEMKSNGGEFRGPVYEVRVVFEPMQIFRHTGVFYFQAFSFIDRLIPAKHRERMGYIDGSNSQSYYFF